MAAAAPDIAAQSYAIHGQLPHPGSEQIIEGYYRWPVRAWVQHGSRAGAILMLGESMKESMKQGSKKIDLATTRQRIGSGYPPPFDQPCLKRVRNILGDAAGLTQFGVNLLRLAPGVWSSQRHWHSLEDEFIYVVSGEVVLVTDGAEEPLRAGDCAGFAAGVANAHHLQNRSDADALILEIGSRRPDADDVEYPDIDLRWGAAHGKTHKDGTPYA